MSVTLRPRNKSIGEFNIGSWSWSYLLELAGPVVPGFWNEGSRWYRVMSDKRFKDLDYPEILGDSGRHFYVKASEARHLATIARNWAAIQEHLPEENREWDSVKRDYENPFPRKVRDDWVDLFNRFAEWASKSHGFSK